MAHLIRIGNSQGLRIPKPLIEQALLDGKELRFEVLAGGGLVIRPLDTVRAGWAEQIQETLQTHGTESLDSDWLDAPLVDEDWDWA